MGVLYHDNRLLRNVFKESDLEVLSYFAAQAAIDLDRSRMQEELNSLKERYEEGNTPSKTELGQSPDPEGIIGTSPALRQVLEEIDLLAKTDSAVLILGETGVGKNVFAAAIHRRSLRQKGPFICVQCNALTESLITSELFGHEKGAFTGATDRRIGRFELAHGGTLFLDEIGDLSLDVQARLLRVLQSKEFERVGGGRETLTSDFRLITATNRDLEEEVATGRFRQDLFYRIGVFPLYIPPLRARTEDIPQLAAYFLQKYAPRERTGSRRIPDEIMARLVRYAWPGNIRELENVIRRGLILGRGSRFRLPDDWMEGAKKAERPNEPQTLRDVERRHIVSALEKARWKVHGQGGAAEILDINPRTLISRMKKIGIKRPPHS
jgi:transcriptional regulator with GAF, ATPase, and Fis domain